MSGVRGGAGAGGSNSVNGKGTGVASSIPQASKKIVQSLKEIVNCPEAEIYSMLKECDMDPNEAVDRLLSQDPFHEVKSKREKKKENKDGTESRSRGGGNNTSNRGGRGGNDRRGRESSALRSKPSQKRDNGASYPSSSNNINDWCPPAVSEKPVENKSSVFNVSEGVPSLHQSAGFRSPWSAVPGQLSMADIVKMGRPHGKAFSNVNSSHQGGTHHHAITSQAAPTPHELYSSHNYAGKGIEANVNVGVSGNQSILPDDEWPQDEQPPTSSVPLISEPSVIPETYKDRSSLPFDGTKHHLDEVQYVEDADVDLRRANMQDESSAGAPILNDELHDTINSYRVDQHIYEQQQVEDVGVSVVSVATNMQQLSFSKEEEEEDDDDDEEEEEEEEEEDEDSYQEGDSPAVKIPDHLLVQSADCSHLSFGSFGSGMGAPFSGPFTSSSPQGNVVETSTAAGAPSVGYIDARNADYYDDEHRTASDGNSDHRLTVSGGSYDIPSASQPETLKQESAEAGVPPGTEYSYPSASPNYTYENSQQAQHLHPSFSQSQISAQMQSLHLSGIMSHSNMPSSLLPSNVHTARDAELSYLPFPISQSMPTKYGSSLASINGPTNSMTEALKTGNLSSPQLTQNIPGGSISGGPAFPQHLPPVHPYSQPSLPFPNMISYPPFLPQSYYMQFAAAGNNTYHQSLSAGVLPQYKNSVPVSNLPQSATAPSGYGAFGSSSNIPGNFSLNPPPAAAPQATSMSYDDVLSSQYKDAAHMLALQQNESSQLWVQGPGSRTMSAVPASTYYGFQGQNQQPAGYRQTQQQPSQHYANPGGYQNFYHNQSGVPLEHQQQMSRDGSLVGAQGQQQQQQPKQPQQIWQNSLNSY